MSEYPFCEYCAPDSSCLSCPKFCREERIEDINGTCEKLCFIGYHPMVPAKRYEIPGNIGCNPGNWVFFIDSIQDIDEEYDTNDFV